MCWCLVLRGTTVQEAGLQPPCIWAGLKRLTPRPGS